MSEDYYDQVLALMVLRLKVDGFPEAAEHVEQARRALPNWEEDK